MQYNSAILNRDKEKTGIQDLLQESQQENVWTEKLFPSVSYMQPFRQSGADRPAHMVQKPFSPCSFGIHSTSVAISR